MSDKLYFFFHQQTNLATHFNTSHIQPNTNYLFNIIPSSQYLAPESPHRSLTSTRIVTSEKQGGE